MMHGAGANARNKPPSVNRAGPNVRPNGNMQAVNGKRQNSRSGRDDAAMAGDEDEVMHPYRGAAAAQRSGSAQRRGAQAAAAYNNHAKIGGAAANSKSSIMNRGSSQRAQQESVFEFTDSLME